MAKDPSYVRLREALAGSVLVDIETGWSISGMDVLPYPKDEAQRGFVKGKLRAGVLEVSSRAEYDEVHDDGQEVEIVYKTEIEVPYQEGQVRQKADARRQKVQAARTAQSDRLASSPWSGTEEDDDDDVSYEEDGLTPAEIAELSSDPKKNAKAATKRKRSAARSRQTVGAGTGDSSSES